MKYGVAGIGIYWCIVEMLFEESGYLNIDEYERISFELRTDNETIKSVIEDYNLFLNDGIKFWSESAISRLTERMNKSTKARASVMKRWNKGKPDTNVLQTNNDSNTSKVKESKVKEYIYNQFYDEQLKLSESNKDYETFIKWLFGDNIYSRPLNAVLGMKEQLSWDQIPKLIDLHKESGTKIKPALEKLENWLMSNPTKKRSTIIGMLRTFMKPKSNK